MGNAPEDVKRQATHVTTSNEDEGFANAVDQFILPRATPAGTDVLKATGQLHRLGQSLWLDNITRDLLTSGTLQRYIDDLSVTGLTSNPTIFEQAIKNSSAYDAAISARLAQRQVGRGAVLRARARGPHARRGSVSPHPRADQRHGRVGVARGLAAARLRHRRDDRGRQDALLRAGRPSEPDDQDPRDRGRTARDRGGASSPASRSTSRCCSRASTTSPPPKRSCAASNGGSTPGLKPDVASVASVFVSRWDSAVAGDRAGRAAQSARHRRRQAHLQGVPGAPQLAALAARLQRRRPAAAAAVGEHRHQGSEGVRRPVHQGAGRTVHGQHHPRGDAEGARGSRRAHRDSCRPTAGTARRCSRGSPAPAWMCRRSRPGCRRRAPRRSSSRGTR